jgi:hypothetical protein
MCHVYRYVKTLLPWERRVKNKARICQHTSCISCLLLYMWINTNSPGISLIRAPQKCTCITYSNVPKNPRDVCLAHWQNLTCFNTISVQFETSSEDFIRKVPKIFQLKEIKIIYGYLFYLTTVFLWKIPLGVTTLHKYGERKPNFYYNALN